ncbi:MAG TPA: IPT/TIG domain-containing protein [Kofleriaceae bacterium]|jgi:subtilisin family serine protease
MRGKSVELCMACREVAIVGLLTSLAGSVVACSINDDVPAPAISAVTPDHGVPGTLVTVTGSYLCQQPRGNNDDNPLACAHVGTLLFDTLPASASAYGDAAVTAEVPALPVGRSSVAVAVAGRSSNRLGFVVE